MRDLRLAFRSLIQNPGFTFIAILSLALGIGANTAMFSFVDAMLLRPLPVSKPGRIVEVDSTAPGTRLGRMSYPDYADLRDQTRTLDATVCYEIVMMGVSVARDAVPQVNLGVLASGNFFSGLDIEMPLGRAFRPDEDQTPGRDMVAVIGHSMWEREFKSDPSAIGRKIRVNGTEFTVVGVAPAGFTGPESFILPEVYLPMNAFQQVIPGVASDHLTARGKRSLTIFGRLKPGVSAAEAQAELATISRRLTAQYPDTNRDRSVTVLNYQRARFENDPIDSVLSLTLLAVTGLVLLIACANVANLLLARGTARAREVAIRMAIGASRGRLVRQLLTESLLLALAGGLGGLAVGYAGVQFLSSIPLPSDFPLSMGVRMDSRLLIFSLVASIATGIVFGLAPALRATRADLASAIKSSDQGPSRISFWRGRFTSQLSGRNVLVMTQLTLSVVLLILSAFFVRGFQAARAVNAGFRTDHTLFFSLDPSLVRYNEERARTFYRQLRDRLQDMAGVKEVSLSSSIPYNNNQNSRRILVEGYQARPGEDNPSAWATAVDDHYFPLMETSISRGRGFDSRDTASSPPVAIVNETLAARMWPNRDPIGQRMRLDKESGPQVEVVGIARDTKYLYWAEAPQAAFFTPFSQNYSAHMMVEVRTLGDPAAMAEAARAQVRALDPDMPIFNMNTMGNYYHDRAMLGPRLLAQMVTAIGLAGLLLAVIGLYGVVAYAVGRRTREIGIRMAVGARPVAVLRMVLGQGLLFTAVGVVAGVSIALLAGRFFKDFVIGVSPHDPAILIGVPLILTAVMIGACAIPARRAARVDPTRALRQE
jgi:predicted permease